MHQSCSPSDEEILTDSEIPVPSPSISPDDSLAISSVDQTSSVAFSELANEATAMNGSASLLEHQQLEEQQFETQKKQQQLETHQRVLLMPDHQLQDEYFSNLISSLNNSVLENDAPQDKLVTSTTDSGEGLTMVCRHYFYDTFH